MLVFGAPAGPAAWLRGQLDNRRSVPAIFPQPVLRVICQMPGVFLGGGVSGLQKKLRPSWPGHPAWPSPALQVKQALRSQLFARCRS